MKPAAFKSPFAILDVMQGRAALHKRLDKHINEDAKPIRVRIEMSVDYAWSSDDGVSQEFSCTVHSIKEYAR